MGSSPKSDFRQPANQGPPESQVTPAQAPPSYVNFLDNPNADGMKTWDDAAMSQAIAGNDAKNAAAAAEMYRQQQAAEQEQQAAQPRDALAQMLAQLLRPAPRFLEGGGGSNRGGYTSSGHGTGGTGGGPGWGGGIGGGMGGRSSGGLY